MTTKSMENLYDSILMAQDTTVLYEKDYKFVAPNLFQIIDTTEHKNLIQEIHFQNGQSKEYGINGVTDENLISILIKRLECFQENPDTSCMEYKYALSNLIEARIWLKEKLVENSAKA